MKDFIEVTQISEKTGDTARRLIPKKEIISIVEVDGITFILMNRDYKGRIKTWVGVLESFDFLCNMLNVLE